MNFPQWIKLKKRKTLIGAAVLIFCLIFFHSWILFHLGSFLVVEKPIQEADALIVLSGSNGERVHKAVELYQKGRAPILVMSGGGKFYGKNEAEYMAEFAISRGVPSSNILLDQHATSTYTNSTYSLPIVQTHLFKRIVIVTSKYHTRRSFGIFRQVFRDASVELGIVGCDDGIDYRSWWKNYDMAETILIEWAKTVLYWLKY